MIKQMNKYGFINTAIVIIILVVIAGGVGGYVWFGQNGDESVVEESLVESASIPDDWETYINSEFGYQISYPSDFDLIDTIGQVKISIPENHFPGTNFDEGYLVIDYDQNKPIERCGIFNVGRTLNTAPGEPVNINGYEFRQTSGGGGHYSLEIYEALKDDICYGVTLQVYILPEGEMFESEKAFTVLRQILSTFSFANQQSQSDIEDEISNSTDEEINDLIEIDDPYLPLFTDGEKVFLYSNVIQGANPKTIEALTKHILKDDKNVFRVRGSNTEVVEGLSPENLRVVNEGYPILLANDTQVYIITDTSYSPGYFTSVVPNPAKLDWLYSSLGSKTSILTDSTKFYILLTLGNNDLIELPISNPKILRRSLYIKGDERVFYDKNLISSADPKTFVLIPESRTPAPDGENIYSILYTKDKTNVYYKDRVVVGADPLSFQVYSSNYYQEYARDKSNVYVDGEIIVGANPDTFVILKQQPYEGCGVYDQYSKDDRFVYYGTRRVENADPKTFRALGNGVSKDATRSFYHDIEINISPEDLSAECFYG